MSSAPHLRERVSVSPKVKGAIAIFHHDDHAAHWRDDRLRGEAVGGDVKGRIDDGGAQQAERVVPHVVFRPAVHGSSCLHPDAGQRRDGVKQDADKPERVVGDAGAGFGDGVICGEDTGYGEEN